MLWSWLVLSIAVALCAFVLPDFKVKGTWGIIKVAALFGLLNWALGWLIFWVIGIGTLGLGFLLAFVTRWIVTALLLKLTDALTETLTIKNFSTAFLAALLISATGTLGEWLIETL